MLHRQLDMRAEREMAHLGDCGQGNGCMYNEIVLDAQVKAQRGTPTGSTRLAALHRTASLRVFVCSCARARARR
eukprot:1242560-Prymnesium_polylepis.1